MKGDGIVAEVVTTKTFRNGGSLAIRIPAGWVSDGEVTLTRDPKTGEISVSQRSAKMAALLAEFMERGPIDDRVFEEALRRIPNADQRSVFERQDDDAAAGH
jgi:virulence-associated protein VagC